MFSSGCQLCFQDYDSEWHKIMVGSCGHSLCLACQLSLTADTCPFCNLPGSFADAIANSPNPIFSTDCQICFLDYDTEEHKIIVGSCGHSLCLACQRNLAAYTCPFCNLPGSFTNVVVNDVLSNAPNPAFSTDCQICFQDYDTEEHKIVVGSCGHSVCLACQRNMTANTCPFCYQPESFANAPIAIPPNPVPNVTFPTDCQICFLDYDPEERKIMVGSCGHSLCLACKVNLAANTCPFCNLPGSFTNAVPNFLAMEMLNSRDTVSNEDDPRPTVNETVQRQEDTQGITDQLLAQLLEREDFIILQRNVIKQLTRALQDQDNRLEGRNLMLEVLSNQLREKEDDLKAKEQSKKWKLFGRKKDKTTENATFYT